MRVKNLRGTGVLLGVWRKATRGAIVGIAIGIVVAGAGYTSQSVRAAQPPVAYSGDSRASLLDIQALQIATFNVAGLNVQPTAATTNTTATPRSAADAANLGGSVVGIDIGPLLLDAHSQAPASSTDSDTLLSLGANPLLSMDAINVDTTANWPGDAVCAADTIAHGITNVADLGVADLGVISLISASVLTSESKTALVPTGAPSDERALQSLAAASVESLSIAGVEISVDGTPTITATASGQVGGATAVYDAPTVTVGSQVLTLGQSVTVDAVGLGLPGLTPQLTVTMNNPTLVQQPDGSQANGSVAVLSVRVFQPVALLPDIEILDLDLMPLSATADLDATVGGLQCSQAVDPVIDATDDTYTTVEGGGVVGNVFANDTLDAAAVAANDVQLTVQDPNATGIMIGTNGDVDVPATTAAGVYILTYQICAVSAPAVCNTATVTVTVTSLPDELSIIVAEDDSFVINRGQTQAGSVTYNDTVDGLPVNLVLYSAALSDSNTPSVFSLTPLDHEDTVDGAMIDAGGNLVVPADTTAGTYAMSYQVCEIAQPDNCDPAAIALTVLASDNPDTPSNPDPDDPSNPDGTTAGANGDNWHATGGLASTGWSTTLVGLIALGVFNVGAAAWLARQVQR